MSDSIFDNRESKPTEKMLSDALGKTFTIWQDIKNYLASEYGELTEDWKFYNQKSGWLLKILKKKRNLFFFNPQNGYFKITFVFGDKAVTEIEKSDLPDNIKQTLRNAKKYMEGRGLQLEVKSSQQLDTVKKLVAIKVQN